MGNNSTPYGKIQYVEPNDILEKKEYGEGSFNITHPYEDYCISVDLEVTVPNRMGTLQTETYTISYANTYSGDTVSFFSGENGLLSTSPGSMTYKDIMNGDTENNRESLGITNIHISYNSYFYPTVTINFSDVRAESLMGVKEENYRRNEMNNASSEPVYTEKVKTFFESLFAFPYPEFKLRVKGFYGKKVEYSLVVSNFRSSFNNQTGNFDVTVEFIGKMYGVYTDIPMSYLMIAPYCTYGSHKGYTTVWEEKEFKFDNGAPIPKFIDLKEDIIKTNAKINSSFNVEVSEKEEKINKKSNLLTEVENAYRVFKKVIFDNGAKGDKDIDIILCPIDDGGNCKYLYSANDSQVMTYQKELFKYIKDFNGIGEGDSLPDVINESEIGEENYKTINAKKENDGTVSVNLDALNNNIQSDIKNFLKDEFKNEICGATKSYVIIDGWNFKERIDSLSKSYEEKLKEIKKNYKEQIGNFIANELKFVPSIKNVFMVLMAHLDTFITIYSRFVQNVTGNKERKVSDFGNVIAFSDIISNNILPPFPAIKDNNKNEFCYPTGTLGRQMEETLLIDRLLDGAQTFSEDADSTRRLVEQFNDSSLDFIPTCLTDLIVQKNPYETALNTNDSENCLDWIYTYFGYRCAQKLIFEENKYSLENIFGELEAYNFWRVNQNLTKKNIDILKNETSSDFYDFIVNKDNSTKCYSNNKCEKILQESTKGDIMIPTSAVSENKEYYAPAVIGRDENGFTTFIDDIEKPNPKFAFIGKDIRSSKPYRFIEFIDEGILDEWENNLNNSDIVDGKTNFIKNIKDDSVKNWFIDRGEYITNLNLSITSGGKVGFISTSDTSPQFCLNDNDYFNEEKNKNFYSISKLYDKKEGSDEYIYDSLNLDIITRIKSDEHSIIHYIPVFLIEDLTVEDFLLCFPINWGEVCKYLMSGNCLLKIPYVIQLVIGYIMCVMSIDEEYIEYSKMYDTKEKRYSFLQNIIRLTGKQSIECIFKIITVLTRDKNGLQKYENYDKDVDDVDADIVNMCTKKFGYKDILELKEKFKGWATNENPGGFLYFKEHFALKENIKEDERPGKKGYVYSNDYGDISFGDKSTQYDRLHVLLSKSEFIDDKSNDEWEKYSPNIKEIYSKIIKIKTDNVNYRFYLRFNQNYEHYKYLNEFVKKYDYLVLPYNHTSDNDCGSSDTFKKYFKSFKEKLLELYDDNISNEIYSSNAGNIDHKLAMYQTLKNLYDKHFNTIVRDEEKYHLTSKYVDTEFKRFHFVDSFFNNLSDEFLINADYLVEILNIVTDGYASGKGEGTIPSEMSVYSFMSMICQKHNMMLMATPVFNNSFTTKEGVENLEKMFTPLPYVECINNNVMSGPSYICFYPHKASHHLDNPSSQYPNDGFNITDLNGTAEFNGPLTIGDLENSDENDYIIPAFGVEYGTQKQSIFKNININMDNPQTTEVAVATQFALANRNNEDMTKLRFEGQDLFKIYSNYSFTCNVEMMGCAQIQPLMYFQLNNIPMFRGAYIIIQVEHDITPGNMTTSFKGVRLNRTKIPMKSSGVDAKMMNAESHPGENKSNDSTIASSYNGPDLSGITGHGMTQIPLDENYNAEDMRKKHGNYFEIANPDSFNSGNIDIRRIAYALANDMKTNGYGIYLTSLGRTRPIGSYTSDHLYGSSLRIDENHRRKKLYGYDINNNTVRYDYTGCAMDMHGKGRNLIIDRGESSIILFNLIATKYTKYIRQLIWEEKNQGYAENIIGNVVHFATYGEYPDRTDKTEIYCSANNTNGWWGAFPVKLKNGLNGNAPTNLPSQFIYTLYLMRKQNVLYDYIKLNNFIKWNGSFKTSDLTEEILERWCKELKVI
jgi:hypothetical protein